jgi:roadblock/LC7 domain-containing protein
MPAGYTSEEIATLKSAIASGVLTVSYAGPPARTVTYQSLSEMRKQLAIMVAEVAGSNRRRFRRAYVKKGF